MPQEKPKKKPTKKPAQTPLGKSYRNSAGVLKKRSSLRPFASNAARDSAVSRLNKRADKVDSISASQKKVAKTRRDSIASVVKKRKSNLKPKKK